MRLSSCIAIATLATACIEARDIPGIPPQARVQYGPQIFLVDDTRSFQPNGGECTRLGTVATTTTSTVNATDGRDERINPGIPHNCFVQVEPRVLRVDVHEVTNELYQLCVDSGACLKPDPSKGSKSQVCSNDGDFDRCPVVEVTQSAAELFCRWIGRRIPTGIEHIIMRQADAADTSDPTQIPIYPTGMDDPDSCDKAITAAGGSCNRPRPVLTKEGSVTGGSPGDRVTGQDDSGGSVAIFDLIGNVTEWTADTIPKNRGNADTLPWFCTAALPDPTTPGQPECPVGSACIFGQYRPVDGQLGIHPVCITNDNGQFNGEVGSLAGGSYRDNTIATERFGTFARRTEANPQDPQDTNNALEYGFRCVGSLDEEANARMQAMTAGNPLPVYPIEINRTQ